MTLDVSNLMRVPMVDLGATFGPEMAGILAPECESGEEKMGVTSQFLADAATYHERMKAAPFREELANALARLDPVPRAAIVLDFGAGSGRSVLPCLDLLPDSRVVAVDISPDMLRILKHALLCEPRFQGRTALIAAHLRQAYFEAGLFDLVIGAQILHHLIEPEKALQAAGAILKPGGHAVFFEPFENGNSILRMAYGEILDEVERGKPLGQASAQAMKALVTDFDVRSRLTSDSPLLNELDDKWMFTRSFFEQSAENAGFAKVQVYPNHPLDKPFRLRMERSLILCGGAEAAALPEWAWHAVDYYDGFFSESMKKELLVGGTVILSK